MSNPRPPRTLGDLAMEIRSKNAGPFWITLEAFMPDQASFHVADQLITTDLIGRLYNIPTQDIQRFSLPQLQVVKVSFPRTTSQGSLHDRDIHAGQHHVPLATYRLPPAAQ